MIPEGSMLLITYSEQQETKSKKSKIKTAAEKIGRVYDFQPLKDGQLKSFIEKRFNLAGKTYAAVCNKFL